MKKIKNDNFRHARGGNTKIYDLNCSKCGTFILKYQKDGIGDLLRLYFDRIIDLSDLSENLNCPKCNCLIGTKMIYKPESRLAYRLLRGSVGKKITGV